MSELSRRGFLRAAALAAAATACSGATTPRSQSSPTTPAPTSPSASPATTAPTGPAWRRIAATGPAARRDASLTGDRAGGVAYLFGGRSGSGTILNDLWIFDLAAQRWERIEAPNAPRPRFGHSAGMVDGVLVVFGGQGGPNSFFDDLHIFDPATRRWRPDLGRTRPAARYGAGEAVTGDGSTGDRLVISHGFTNSGRFDDTWMWVDGAWRDASPTRGERPVKRCLHRMVYWNTRFVLFGGQTTGRPFLNDLWVLPFGGSEWTEKKPGTVPSPRNLFAMFAVGGRIWVYGGYAGGGEIGDMWSLADVDGAWQPSEPAGPFPLPRGGMAATATSDEDALMFGGRSGDADLDELWAFRAPFGRL